jgi:hypothetical protein
MSLRYWAKPTFGLVTRNDRFLSELPEMRCGGCAQVSWSGSFDRSFEVSR